MIKSFTLGWALFAGSLFSLGCSSDHDSKGSDGTKCVLGAEEAEHVACNECLERSCASQYSALCAANCEASSSSTACTQATDALASCGVQQCAAECDVEVSNNGGSSNGGSNNGGSNNGGSSNGGSSVGGSSVGGAGPGGSSNGAGGSSGASGPSTATASCYRAADSVCTRTEVAKGFLSQYNEACTQQNGQPVCPEGIIGCCALAGSKLCVYSSKTFDETSCPQIGGKWSSN